MPEDEWGNGAGASGETGKNGEQSTANIQAVLDAVEEAARIRARRYLRDALFSVLGLVLLGLLVALGQWYLRLVAAGCYIALAALWDYYERTEARR